MGIDTRTPIINSSAEGDRPWRAFNSGERRVSDGGDETQAAGGVRPEPCSQHERQNDPDDDKARNSVRDEPYPDALIPLRGKGLSQHPIENAGRHTPRLVQVVEAKDGPLTTQSILPNTLRIRGSKSPRKNSSSTHGARKLTNTSSAERRLMISATAGWGCRYGAPPTGCFYFVRQVSRHRDGVVDNGSMCNGPNPALLVQVL